MTKHIKLCLLVGGIIFMMLGNAIAQNKIVAVPQENGVAMSYQFKDGDDTFFKVLVDTVKAGKKLALEYRIKLSTTQTWSKTIAKGKSVKEVSYNVIDDTYHLVSMQPQFDIHTNNEEDLRNFVLSAEDVLVHYKKTPETGTELEADVSVVFNEHKEKGWLNRMSVSSLLGENKLKEKVMYIAR